MASALSFCPNISSVKKLLNSSYVTSYTPIQNGDMLKDFCGPSSLSRPASVGGLPMVKVPALMGTILNFKFNPGTDCSYATNDVSDDWLQPIVVFKRKKNKNVVRI